MTPLTVFYKLTSNFVELFSYLVIILYYLKVLFLLHE